MTGVVKIALAIFVCLELENEIYQLVGRKSDLEGNLQIIF
jgi:hypothetical protein